MKRFKATAVCSDCGGKSFTLSMIREAESRGQFVMHETMSRVGLGPDLNKFVAHCSHCSGEMKVMVEDVP